jgi:hypothetical protein
VGVVGALCVRRPPVPLVQWLLVLAAATALAGAWALATR